MRILVISDIHLHKYDHKKITFFKKIIKNYDKIIINGDFWDNWFTNSTTFVKSLNKSIFPLLLKKRTVYLYGNHDPATSIRLRDVQKFSACSAENININLGSKSYHIEHGDKLLKDFPKSIPIKTYEKILNLRKPVIYKTIKRIEKIGYNLFPGKLNCSKFAKSKNSYIKKSKPPEIFYITGDTHFAEVDESNMYANSGAILNGYASYLTIDKNGVKLHREKY